VVSHDPLQGPQKLTQSQPGSIRSYSLRRGRLTRAQKRALDRHWTTYGLDLNAGVPACIYQADRPIVLEVGFGNGLSLLQQAQNEPEKCFIGIEVYLPNIGHLLHRLDAEGTTNVFLYHADALDVLTHCVPPLSIDRLQIYFPDPWPKKKHLKRRLIQVPTLPVFLSAIKPGGLLHMATDVLDYAQKMLEVVAANVCRRCELVNRQSGGDFSSRPAWRPETRFELTGRAENRQIYDLVIAVSN